MEGWSSMKTEKDIYALLGELSVKFSTLEFGISAILEVLIDSNNPAIGAILTDGHSLNKNLTLITRVIPFKFENNSQIPVRLKALITEVDGLRNLRNLFIHGKWLIDENQLQNNMVTCFDLRLKSSQKGLVLNRLTEHNISITELEDHVVKVGRLVVDSFKIARELGCTNLNVE